MEQLITRYSRGEAVHTLRGSFPEIVEALSACQREPRNKGFDFGELDAYVYALWLVSLGFLLDIDETLIRTLLKELGNEGTDALFERLVSSKISGRPNSKLLVHPNPYQILLEAANSKGELQIQLIQKFLSGYYTGMRQTYWHDSHLGEDAGFFGYWCFELAALVKVLGINDDAFSHNVFYPVDLVRSSKTFGGFGSP